MRITGITIGTGEPFGLMARLAAHEFTRRTGCPARVLDEADQHAKRLDAPHHLKFRLFDFVAADVDAVVFFDADLVFCRPFDAATLFGPSGFSAARDLSSQPWIVDDAARAGVSPAAYFNSGLMAVHRRRRNVLAHAGLLTNRLLTPFKDQTHLNAACRRLRVPVDYLPQTLNWHVDREHTATLDGVVAAHVHWAKQLSVADLHRLYSDEVRSLFWRSAK